MSVPVNEPGHQPGQHVGRVGHRTAEEARVQVLVRALHFNLHVSQTAQTTCNRGCLQRQHRGIRHQNDVGLEHLPVLTAEVVKACRTDLLLALEHELHVAGQRVGGTHRLECLGVHPQLPLVVIGAAGPDAAIADDRLEGVRTPLVARIHRHHVVVAVDQHRACLRIDGLLGIDHRIPGRGVDLRTVGPGPGQGGSQPFGAALHVGFVGRFGADRRNADQVEQLLEETRLVRFDVFFYVLHIHNVQISFCNT